MLAQQNEIPIEKGGQKHGTMFKLIQSTDSYI